MLYLTSKTCGRWEWRVGSPPAFHTFEEIEDWIGHYVGILGLNRWFLYRRGRTAESKRKLGVRERLSRKLLSGRAAAAAAGELAAVEAASHRERMSNRWEEV